MPDGCFALMLHAHLPYVRHPEYPEFLEEDWLYEAITETYVPLLEIFERLASDDVPFRVAMSITPPLASMLRDPLLQERYRRHLGKLTELCERELTRTAGQQELHAVVRMYHGRLRRVSELYDGRWKGDLVGAFARLEAAGFLEIATCAATHGFLPLMADQPEAQRAQIMVARDFHRATFGRDPRGIWLPECAYTEQLLPLLQQADLRWFVLDAHGLMFGRPRPRYAIFAPVYTPAGPAAFARDRESSRQVWSAEEGYPGDPAYRDFYRDIGFDLPERDLRPFLSDGAPRKFTGLKYHRITGQGSHKELYRREWAMAAAEAHARHFMEARARQIGELNRALNRPPILLSPFDAELFGHWWFEGPEFLELFIRKAAYDQREFRFVTPAEYLRDQPTLQIVRPCESSWGNRGYWEVWLDESNSWIYPHLHEAARRMTAAARRHRENARPSQERSLRAMGRELLLAQSSDWAFLMKTGTARPYAEKRTRDHLLRFQRLETALRDGQPDEAFLAECETRAAIFPELEWRHWC